MVNSYKYPLNNSYYTVPAADLHLCSSQFSQNHIGNKLMWMMINHI